MEQLWSAINYAYQHDKLTWDIALVVAFLASAYTAGHFLRKKEPTGKKVLTEWELLSLFKPRRRGMKNMKKARINFIESLIIDDFVDAVEKRVFSEELSRTEATKLYQKMKRLFPVRDLFPSPELLKETIKRRLGTHEPVPLPGSEPAFKRKHLFDKPVKA